MADQDAPSLVRIETVETVGQGSRQINNRTRRSASVAESLLDQVPSDTSGDGHHREFRRGQLAVKAARWSCAQVAYVRAGRPSSRRTVSVVSPASRA
ncbi:UNVERIFIED_CONTAM: hypothetical protein RKD50_009292 [Streptomyces canus]